MVHATPASLRACAARGMKRAAAAAALLAGCAAQAQSGGSVNDYRLPPPPPAPQPEVEGPVDPERPVVAPRPTSTPTSTPTPSAPATSPAAPRPSAPRIVLPPVAATPAPGQRPATPRPTPAHAAAPRDIPAALPAEIGPTGVGSAPPARTAPSSPAPAPIAAVEGPAAPGWAWLLPAGAVAALAAAAMLWKRRRRVASEAQDEGGETLSPPPSPQPEPSAPAILPPVRPAPAAHPPRPAPPPETAAVPRPAPPAPAPPLPQAGPLEVALEARHFSRAMVNATLAYQLLLTNRGEHAIDALRVFADITTAHASLPAEQQLSLDGATLAAVHQEPGLAPGDSVRLSGELRLPLAQIMPIPSGGAHVFVPLARFRLECGLPSGDRLALTRIFVIGRTAGGADTALRPFVLEQGPGVQRDIGQRMLRAIP